MWEHFKNPQLAKQLLAKLKTYQKPFTVMEVCGTHTMAIGHLGLRKLLPGNIRLISGPGCPVCVTPAGYIDALCSLENVTVATFGDMLRVPGTNNSLEQARAQGLPVNVVYSPLQALELAKHSPVVLAGIGFETTAPAIALTIIKAKQQGITNLSVLCAFKRIKPALQALVANPQLNLDGFILPGHVSVVLGTQVYSFLADEAKTPGVIAGFEAVDILAALLNLAQQKANNTCTVQNLYQRAVKPAGNPKALKIMQQVLQPQDSVWRGLGLIENSGLGLKPQYASFDAAKRYNLDINKGTDSPACRCGQVLTGVINPPECPLFGQECTPAKPVGACMVSSEGTCAAWYRYER